MRSALPALREFHPPAPGTPDGRRQARERQEALCEEAYRRGLAEGGLQAQQTIEAELRDVIAALRQDLETLDELRNALTVQLTREFGEALAQMAHTLAPLLAERGYADALQTVIRDTVESPPEPLTLRVHPDMASIARAHVGAEIDTIRMEEHPELDRRRFELAWTDGAIIKDMGAVAAKITDLADRFASLTANED